MKKITYLFSAIFACLLMVACDANKGKVSDLAEKFVKAVSENDKVTIYELYPSMRNMNVLTFPANLSDEIDVEFDETDSVYVAKLGDDKSLIVKVFGEDKLQIIDSYKVFRLDSLTYELAAKVGAPVNSKSDMWNGKYFDDKSHFIDWLNSNGSEILSDTEGYYTWRSNYQTCKIQYKISNKTKHTINGEDYTINFQFRSKKTGKNAGSRTELGRTLAPGESFTDFFYKDDLYNLARRSDLNWTTSFQFKDKNQAHVFAKYGEFKGDEYDRHINRVGWGCSWDFPYEGRPNYDEENKEKVKELGITEGILFTKINPNSPAEEYGLKQWDVIMEIDGQSVKNGGEFSAWEKNKKKGDAAKVKIIRDKKEMVLDIILTNSGDTIPAN